jgi:ubiquinone/menaquinone biosynthesis C-methylase UbiE
MQNKVLMTATERAVAHHYAEVDPGTRVYAGLRAAGLDSQALDADSLAPVDEFHIRGREATIELAGLVELGPDMQVLDVGCGIGGSARYLAETFGCRVTGVDLVSAYCDLATELSARVGLSELTTFRQASAVGLPFEDDSFDIVWTEHAQMNISDKDAFYGEIARVLRPGGHLAFHDMFAGNGEPVAYPTPWASRQESSFLLAAAELPTLLAGLDLEPTVWRDTSEVSTKWFRAVRDRIAAEGPPAVGVHLLMGDSASTKVANATDAYESGALVALQAVLRKQV